MTFCGRNNAVYGKAVRFPEVKALRLLDDRDSRRFVDTVLATECGTVLDPPYGKDWAQAFFARIRLGEVVAYATVVLEADSCVVGGLFWGAVAESGIWTVHQTVAPWARHHGLSWRQCRAASDLGFEEVRQARAQMGLTPVSNRASVWCARRAGFRLVGVVPGWYRGADCALMWRGRSMAAEV